MQRWAESFYFIFTADHIVSVYAPGSARTLRSNWLQQLRRA